MKTYITATSWKTQYMHNNGQITSLQPGKGVTPGEHIRTRGRVNVGKENNICTIKSEWYRKREMNKLQQCNFCSLGETDKENMLLTCAYCNNNIHENCDEKALFTDEEKTGNTCKCLHCKKKREKKVIKVEDRIWEYNEQRSDTCCRCQIKL